MKLEVNQIQKNLFNQEEPLDLKIIPQNSGAILEEVSNSNKVEEVDFSKYIVNFFQIWQSKISDHKINLPKQETLGDYQENFFKHQKNWYLNLLDNSNFDNLANIGQKFIVTTNTNLRFFPTNKPSYHNPLIAGQGYPFDNLQQNLLRIGEPLLFSHYSKDQKFAFVITNAKSYGFVMTQDIALIDNQLINDFMNSDFAMIKKDETKLYFSNHYYASLDLGSIIAIKNKKALIPHRDLSGKAKLIEVEIDCKQIITKPLIVNLENIKYIVDNLISKPYGWGGYLFHRDCAQLVKDYFAILGKHTPSFSAQQMMIDHNISLEQLDNHQKLKIINNLPSFVSLLYTRGHIVIYMGKYKEQPIIFHARWGVPLFKDQEEYRYIIGKSVITSLEYGKELNGFDQEKSSFLSTISAATIYKLD